MIVDFFIFSNALKTLNKYYANDLEIKQIKANSEKINYSVTLENIVYNNLMWSYLSKEDYSNNAVKQINILNFLMNHDCNSSLLIDKLIANDIIRKDQNIHILRNLFLLFLRSNML